MAAMTGYDADTKGGKFPHRYRSAVLSYGGSDPAFAQDRRFSVEQFGLTRTQWSILAYLSEPRHDPDRAGSGTEARAR